MFKFLWLKITKLPVRVFSKILISYSIPNVHFVIFERYWSHTQDVQTFIKRIFRICRPPSVSNTLKRDDFRFSTSPSNKMIWDFSCFLLSQSVSSKFKVIGLGNHWHVRKSNNPWNYRLLDFPKWMLKVTDPKLSRIILWSVLAILFLKFTIQMTPQTPSDPKSGCFPNFPGCPVRNRPHWTLWHPTLHPTICPLAPHRNNPQRLCCLCPCLSHLCLLQHAFPWREAI